MLRDLKAIGATNATQARPRALMGRRRWRACAGGARRDAARRAHSGDVRSDLRPRVEGGAAADRAKAHAIVRFEQVTRIGSFAARRRAHRGFIADASGLARTRASLPKPEVL